MYIGINAVIIEAFGRCNRWESWQQVVQWLGDRKTHRRRLSDRFHRSRGWEIWAIACICNLYSCINNNNYTIDFICYVIASATPYTHIHAHIQTRTHIFCNFFPQLSFIFTWKNMHSSLWYQCQLNVLWLKHLNKKPGKSFEYSVLCAQVQKWICTFHGRLNRKWGAIGTVLIMLLFFKVFPILLYVQQVPDFRKHHCRA